MKQPVKSKHHRIGSSTPPSREGRSHLQEEVLHSDDGVEHPAATDDDDELLLSSCRMISTDATNAANKCSKACDGLQYDCRSIEAPSPSLYFAEKKSVSANNSVVTISYDDNSREVSQTISSSADVDSSLRRDESISSVSVEGSTSRFPSFFRKKKKKRALFPKTKYEKLQQEGGRRNKVPGKKGDKSCNTSPPNIVYTLPPNDVQEDRRLHSAKEEQTHLSSKYRTSNDEEKSKSNNRVMPLTPPKGSKINECSEPTGSTPRTISLMDDCVSLGEADREDDTSAQGNLLQDEINVGLVNPPETVDRNKASPEKLFPSPTAIEDPNHLSLDPSSSYEAEGYIITHPSIVVEEMTEDILSLEAKDCNDFFLPDDGMVKEILELEAKDCNYFFADGNIVKDILELKAQDFKEFF